MYVITKPSPLAECHAGRGCNDGINAPASEGAARYRQLFVAKIYYSKNQVLPESHILSDLFPRLPEVAIPALLPNKFRPAGFLLRLYSIYGMGKCYPLIKVNFILNANRVENIFFVIKSREEGFRIRNVNNHPVFHMEMLYSR